MSKKSNSTIESLGEFGLIDQIKNWLPKPNIVAGIGDDTAVFNASKNKYGLLTMDSIVENVDFKRNMDPKLIGRKALAVNLSDIAAMGGTPKYAVVSLTLPKKTKINFVKKFYEGMGKLAKQFHVNVVGGDLSGGTEISCSIALLGESQKGKTIFRKGGKPGDLIGVTGRLGGSILGKHLNFTPRIKEGQFLAQYVTSMIDISDGLWQDLGHLTTESGHSFRIEPAKIPISRDAFKLAKNNSQKALLHAFYDGEDFELLFTISKKRFGSLKSAWKKRFQTPMTIIGEVSNQEKMEKRFFSKRLGYQHF